MINTQPTNRNLFSLFAGHSKVASGALDSLLPNAKAYLESHPDSQLLFFCDQTGTQVDFNLSGSLDDVLKRIPMLNCETDTDCCEVPGTRGRGRPKLGVVSREISLLPRHWEWLEQQSGGASAVLRKLVEQASKASREDDEKRSRLNSAGKFMWALAGDLPDFEEATRALYAGNLEELRLRLANWPNDVKAHVLYLLGGSN